MNHKYVFVLMSKNTLFNKYLFSFNTKTGIILSE